jgi:catechol 2,3-dioxygenase-like lactoylglutathione lyase family enzyme
MRFGTTLPATDMERAKAWYASILQIEPTKLDENGDAWYEAGGTRFLLYASKFAGTNQATAMGVEVEDVAAAVADLRARGAVFEDYDFGDDFRTVEGILTTPDGQKLAWFKDSEGNILSFAGLQD